MKAKSPRKRSKSNASRSPSVQGPKLLLNVEAVAFGGDGLARHEGKVYFIPNALPEQTVEVEVVKDHGRFAHTRLLRTVEKAVYQRESPCPHSDSCGGCQWLEAPYERQLAWKRSFIAAAFQKFAQVELPSDWPIIAAPQTAAYRNRIKLKLHHRPEGDFRWGYYAKSSHDLIPINRCFIAHEAINQVLDALGELRLKAPAQGALYELELQHLPGNDDKVTACFLPAAPDSFMEQLAAAAQSHPSLAQKVIWARSTDSCRPYEVDRDLSYFTHAGQFQQINREANHYLRLWIERQAIALGAQQIVDLFCGSGNLSLGLARSGCQVWGLEVGESAIAAAQVNVRENEIANAQYACGMAHELFQVYPDLKSTKIDLLIVDPPRKGMAEALPSIQALSPKHLIYVSCDPNTLARDIKSLLASGFQIAEVLGLDFFPHSYHIETVVRLTQISH